MKSIAKLKDRARKHEQKENWQAAIEAYQEVLEKEEGADDFELELGLYNRIGDLNLRIGQTDAAVSYYETAADKYAEAGFLNNAIALCNKALRHRPDRPEIYLKLSGLCAEQGFQTDARRWILEYSERQMRAGRVEEALTGLENFADLSRDAEVRETLAQQLASHGRAEEAVQQLRHAYHLRAEAGNTAAAAELAEKARAIDPTADFESEAPVSREAAVEPGFGEEAALAEYRSPGPGAGESTGSAAAPAGPAEAEELDELDGLEIRREELSGADTGAVSGLEGLEATAAEVDVPEEELETLSDLEVSHSQGTPSAAPEEAGLEELGGLETFQQETEDAAAPEELELEEDEEEPEPLPLLDTGFDEEEEGDEEEEHEPLPLLDDDLEQVAAEAVEEASPQEWPEESPEEWPEESPEEWPEDSPEELSAGGEEPLGLDLSGAGGGPIGNDVAPELDEEHAAGAMDLDLGSFGLSMDSRGAPPTPPGELDVETVLNRAREQVSRGLTAEALSELKLLSASDPGPEAFRDALEVVNEVVRHDANDIAALQRRVEYAARTEDRDLLIDAYTDLADALARLGAETKAQVMYERVLGLDPRNEAAREALGGESVEEEDAVDLSAVLREVEPEELTARDSGGGDSDPDFAAMLSQFKAKVSHRAEDDNPGDHYDLGLAFKEMGLIDEAIGEFQAALKGGTERLKVYEELGQCFIQKNQYTVALKVLTRALKVPHGDESELLGVYYHLGQCHEELGQRAEARAAYEQVLAIDESFGDVPDRVARL